MPPHQILPVTLDVGTNNPGLLDDPEYRGLRQRRLSGAAYEALVAEFVAALQAWQPHVLLQFEVGGPAGRGVESAGPSAATRVGKPRQQRGCRTASVATG